MAGRIARIKLALLAGVAAGAVAAAIFVILRFCIALDEAATIDDIRDVISAEAAYFGANAGYYDRLECLVKPVGCVPSYPEAAPDLLHPMNLPGVRFGYVRTFHRGPPPAPGESKAPISRTSMKSYAYSAVPLIKGLTGRRGFCGDSRGVICATAAGSMPEVIHGECAASCPPLQ